MRNSEDYLSLIYDELHAHLGDAKVIHADETPFTVICDGRPARSKSYMWVYCSSPRLERHPVILFDYRATRESEHPKEFLSGYSGVVVSDVFQAYHKLDRERSDITVKPKVNAFFAWAKKTLSDMAA